MSTKLSEQQPKESGGIRHIDYVRFTLKEADSPQAIMAELGLEFTALGHGRYRYREGFAAVGRAVQVFYEGSQEGMGVHVQISGEGCRILESLPSFTNWRDRLRQWHDLGATFTRVDLAIDDHSGMVTVDRVRESLNRRDYASRSRTGWREIHDHRPTGVCSTLYVGKRAGGTMMRCYDKAAQMGEAGPWVRFEFEFQAKRAHALAETFMNEGWDKAVGAIRSFIEFKDPNHETSDVTRRRAAKWWDTLISASKHRLLVAKHGCTSVVKLWAHVQRQWKRTACVMLEANGGDLSWFLDLADKGRQNLGDRHRILLQAARNPGLVLT